MVDEKQKSSIISEIFHNYFNEGKNIGDLSVLEDIAQEYGITDKELQKKVENQSNLNELMKKVYNARARGVSSVPLYIINGKYKISGAQKQDILIQGFRNVEMMERGISLK